MLSHRWDPSFSFIQAKPSEQNSTSNAEPLIFFSLHEAKPNTNGNLQRQQVNNPQRGLVTCRARWQRVERPEKRVEPGERHAERWQPGGPVCFGHLDHTDTSKLSAYRYQLRVLVFKIQFTLLQGNKQTNRLFLSSHLPPSIILFFPQQIFSTKISSSKYSYLSKHTNI